MMWTTFKCTHHVQESEFEMTRSISRQVASIGLETMEFWPLALPWKHFGWKQSYTQRKQGRKRTRNIMQWKMCSAQSQGSISLTVEMFHSLPWTMFVQLKGTKSTTRQTCLVAWCTPRHRTAMNSRRDTCSCTDAFPPLNQVCAAQRGISTTTRQTRPVAWWRTVLQAQDSNEGPKGTSFPVPSSKTMQSHPSFRQNGADSDRVCWHARLAPPNLFSLFAICLTSQYYSE